MGDKDITEKMLEDNNDIFADIVNVLLFKGERVVNDNSLADAVVKSQYKDNKGKLHEQERDFKSCASASSATPAWCPLKQAYC